MKGKIMSSPKLLPHQSPLEIFTSQYGNIFTDWVKSEKGKKWLKIVSEDIDTSYRKKETHPQLLVNYKNYKGKIHREHKERENDFLKSVEEQITEVKAGKNYRGCRHPNYTTTEEYFSHIINWLVDTEQGSLGDYIELMKDDDVNGDYFVDFIKVNICKKNTVDRETTKSFYKNKKVNTYYGIDAPRNILENKSDQDKKENYKRGEYVFEIPLANEHKLVFYDTELYELIVEFKNHFQNINSLTKKIYGDERIQTAIFKYSEEFIEDITNELKKPFIKRDEDIINDFKVNQNYISSLSERFERYERKINTQKIRIKNEKLGLVEVLKPPVRKWNTKKQVETNEKKLKKEEKEREAKQARTDDINVGIFIVLLCVFFSLAVYSAHYFKRDPESISVSSQQKSAGIITYQGGRYIGELKNGIPHGHGMIHHLKHENLYCAVPAHEFRTRPTYWRQISIEIGTIEKSELTVEEQYEHCSKEMWSGEWKNGEKYDEDSALGIIFIHGILGIESVQSKILKGTYSKNNT